MTSGNHIYHVPWIEYSRLSECTHASVLDIENMEGDDCCTICAGTTEGQLTTLECGHTFHVHCALQWFRYHNNTCPNCRSNESRMRWTRKTPRQRVSVIRRRKNLSPYMRRLIKQLDRAREARVGAREERRAFVEEYKDVLKKNMRLDSKISHYHMREHQLIRRIDSEGTEVPHLVFSGIAESDESDEDDPM